MVQRHVLLVLTLAVFHMSHHHQRRAGDKDQLQRPQTDVGDGEDVVIADIGTAGLQRQKEIKKEVLQMSVGSHYR